MPAIKNIDKALLKAGMAFVSNKPNHSWSKVVYIDPHKDGGLMYISMTQHTISIAYDKDATHTLTEPVLLEIDPKELKSFTGYKVSICLDNMNIFDVEKNIKIKKSENILPNWRDAIPNILFNAKHYCGAFNTNYIKSFCDIEKLLGLRKGGNPLVVTGISATESALVRFDGVDNWFGVIMPMRIQDEPHEMPFWMF